MPVKRLGELLQEQQEPFCLDVYLVERGYMRKTLDSKLTSGRRKRTPPCPKILKRVLKKLVPTKDALKMASSCEGTETRNTTFRVSQKSGKAQAHYIEEPVRFSSASSMTVYDSYSGSDIEEDFPSHRQNHIDQVTVTDRTQECGCLEDSKQHSPVSVLEELHSDEGSPFYNHMRCCPRSTLTNRITEESLLSASLWDLLKHSPFEKQGVASPSQCRKTKRFLEQTKQLLFDSLKEVLEIQGRNENQVLGAEKMGKIICQRICFWSEHPGNLTNIDQLLNSDFEKWNDTQPQTKEIEIQISNAILEEMEFEIVSDLIACFSR